MTETQETRWRESFKKWREENTPPGARIDIVTIGSVVEIELCCSGSDEEMCYWCCLEPGHSGLCLSRQKHVDFRPVEGLTFFMDDK